MPNSLLLRRLLGGILVIALLVVVVVTVRFFMESSTKDKQSHPSQPGVDVGLNKIHFTESEAGRKKWELYAEHGEYDKTLGKTTLSGIRFIVDSDQKGSVTVTAGNGEYFHDSKKVILRGGVVARTEDGAFFETPSLGYNSKTRIFNTKERVRFADNGLAVDGVGMDFMVDGFAARVHSMVSATIQPDKRGK